MQLTDYLMKYERRYMFENGIYFEIQDEKAQQNLNKATAYIPYIYQDARYNRFILLYEDER